MQSEFWLTDKAAVGSPLGTMAPPAMGIYLVRLIVPGMNAILLSRT